MKKIIRKLIYRERSTSASYIEFLRKKGVSIGEGCTIFNPKGTIIDYQNPEMLKIGNYARIADGVRILTHDYSNSVLSQIGDGDILGSVSPTAIGNNVFVGMDTIILAGVSVGDNVIIGAGSVVTKSLESNSVYAGNPAKRICTVEELYKKRKSMQIEMAKKVAVNYYNKTGRLPDESVLREYLMIFSKRKEIPNELDELMKDTGNYELSKKYFYKTKPYFSGIQEFLKWCKLK